MCISIRTWFSFFFFLNQRLTLSSGEGSLALPFPLSNPAYIQSGFPEYMPSFPLSLLNSLSAGFLAFSQVLMLLEKRLALAAARLMFPHLDFPASLYPLPFAKTQ